MKPKNTPLAWLCGALALSVAPLQAQDVKPTEQPPAAAPAPDAALKPDVAPAPPHLPLQPSTTPDVRRDSPATRPGSTLPEARRRADMAGQRQRDDQPQNGGQRSPMLPPPNDLRSFNHGSRHDGFRRPPMDGQGNGAPQQGGQQHERGESQPQDQHGPMNPSHEDGQAHSPGGYGHGHGHYGHGNYGHGSHEHGYGHFGSGSHWGHKHGGFGSGSHWRHEHGGFGSGSHWRHEHGRFGWGSQGRGSRFHHRRFFGGSQGRGGFHSSPYRPYAGRRGGAGRRERGYEHGFDGRQGSQSFGGHHGSSFGGGYSQEEQRHGPESRQFGGSRDWGRHGRHHHQFEGPMNQAQPGGADGAGPARQEGSRFTPRHQRDEHGTHGTSPHHERGRYGLARDRSV